MSLVRTALRLAAVEILRNDPVIYAATGGHVFDSEMAAIDPEFQLPIIIVHTEMHSGEAWSVNDGGPPFDENVNIVCEIAHVAWVNEDGEETIFYPETTRELEAALDLLEGRIFEALAFSKTPLAVATRRLVLKRMLDMKSERFASDDIGVRLASRMITINAALYNERSEVFYPGDALPSGPFASLPEPLRSLAPLFAEGSSARQTLELVAAQLSAPAHGDAFEGADMTIDTAPSGIRPQA